MAYLNPYNALFSAVLESRVTGKPKCVVERKRTGDFQIVNPGTARQRWKTWATVNIKDGGSTKAAGVSA